MGARVLFVDDEADFLATLLKRVARRGVLATGVNSGEDAIAHLEREPTDVVVLDVKMPGMSGLETLDRIRADHPAVEVIMLTGHANVEVAVQGMERGAFDYLMKPMELDELLYKIQDACQRKSLRERRERRDD